MSTFTDDQKNHNGQKNDQQNQGQDKNASQDKQNVGADNAQDENSAK